MAKIVEFENFGNITHILGQEFSDGTQEPLQCTLEANELGQTPSVTFEMLNEEPRCYIHPKLRKTAPINENGEYLDIVYDFRVTVQLTDRTSKSNEWYEVDSRFFDSKELQEFLGFKLPEQDQADIIKALEIRVFEDIDSLKNQIQELKNEIKTLKENNNE